MTARTIILSITIGLFACGVELQAQPSDSISRNPNAKELRVLWKSPDLTYAGLNDGDGIAGLGDLFGTGYSAWCVGASTGIPWYIFAGGPDTLSTTPVWKFDHPEIRRGHGNGTPTAAPVVGNSLGTERRLIGLVITAQDTSNVDSSGIYLFRTDYHGVVEPAAAIVNLGKQAPPTQVLAADLDNDGSDELIVFFSHYGQFGGGQGELWFYRGGTGFTGSAPTLIMRDLGGFMVGLGPAITIGHFDGDDRLDMVTQSGWDALAPVLKFYLKRRKASGFIRGDIRRAACAAM